MAKSCVCVCVCLLLLAFFLVTPANATTPTEPASEKFSDAVKSRIQATFLKAPLSFEANQGQADEQVKFIARGAGYSLFLTSTEAVMELRQGQQQSDGFGLKQSRAFSPNPKSSVLRMKLVGANTNAMVAGLQELSGKANYFISNDANKWTTNISTYAKVEYRDVYPGVNLVYYGNQGKLEYDFIVSPGTDPRAIKIAFEGAEAIKTDGRGDLIIRTAVGDLRMHKPLVYQDVAGVRQEIAGNYVLDQESEIENPKSVSVGFKLARYDSSKPLVIDPVLSYSTYLGGGASDEGLRLAIDNAGNAYITGDTTGSNFPTSNALQPASGGSWDAFVAKFDPAGVLVYSTYLGGSSDERGQAIAVDAIGNAYVTGVTLSTNFPTVNALQPSYAGGQGDAFVVKLNPSGSSLVYSTYLGGGTGDEQGFGIAVDTFGNAYVTGYTGSTNFPTKNAFQPSFGGGIFEPAFGGTPRDAFVAKLDPSQAGASSLLYSTYLGGQRYEEGVSIAVDNLGNAYITGYTSSPDFPTLNPLQPSQNGAIPRTDAFVAKFDTTKSGASSLKFSTYFSGTGNRNTGNGIALDSLGNIYVGGYTNSTNFPVVNAIQPTQGGGTYDGFLVKLNPTGSSVLFSTYLGGSGSDQIYGIAVDSLDNVHLTGWTDSANFPVVSAIQPAKAAGIDAFVTKLNSTGSSFKFSTYLGGSGNNEAGVSIAADASGNSYVTGWTDSTNFPTTNAYQSTKGSSIDAFVAKIKIIDQTLVPFSDNFDRPNSPTVGNGWTEVDGSVLTSFIQSNTLKMSQGGGPDGQDTRIYRVGSQQNNITLSGTLTIETGSGATQIARVVVRSDGTEGTGFHINPDGRHIFFPCGVFELVPPDCWQGDGYGFSVFTDELLRSPGGVIQIVDNGIPLAQVNYAFVNGATYQWEMEINAQNHVALFIWSGAKPAVPTLTFENNGSPYSPSVTGDKWQVEVRNGNVVGNSHSHTTTWDNIDIRALTQMIPAPVANAGPDQTVAEGSAVSLDGSGSIGVNLMFSWEQLPGGPSVTLNNSTSAAPTFTAPLLPGGFGSQVLTFKLTVTSGSQSSAAVVNVTVINVNHAPEAHVGADQVVNEGSFVALDGTASFDPDNDLIGYQWIQTSGPSVVLSGVNTATPTFTAPFIPGGLAGPLSLTFSLTVSDGALTATTPSTVAVVNVNHAPIADAGVPQTVHSGRIVTLNGSGSNDPDNDPITYQWVQFSGPAVTLSSATSSSPSFTAPPTSGTTALTFRLSVNDSQLVSSPADVVVTVKNGPPLCNLASASPNILWPPNHGMIPVFIQGVTDPDDGSVVITIQSVTQDEPVNGIGDGDTSPDAVIVGSAALIRAERSGAGNGRVYRINFTANDGQGGTCSSFVKVAVPHDMKPGSSAVDDGQLYNSTQP